MVPILVECFLVWRGGLVEWCFVRWKGWQSFVDAGGYVLCGDWWVVALAMDVLQHRFLTLVHKDFPKDHKLRKIFNRNTIKISYSCMNNTKQIIDIHNKRILNLSEHIDETADNTIDNKSCNCRQKNTCPLNGNCLQSSVIYQATVKRNDNRDLKIWGRRLSRTPPEVSFHLKESLRMPLSVWDGVRLLLRTSNNFYRVAEKTWVCFCFWKLNYLFLLPFFAVLLLFSLLCMTKCAF